MTESQYVRITEKGSDPQSALSKQYTDELLRQTVLVADLPWMLGPFNPDTAQEVLEGFTRSGGQGALVEEGGRPEVPAAPTKPAKRPASKRGGRATARKVAAVKTKKAGGAKAKKAAGAKAKKAAGAKAKKAGSARKAAGPKRKKSAGAKAKKAPGRGKAKGAAKRKR